MPRFEMTGHGHGEDDRPNYNEVIGSKPLADAFAERGGFLRGGIKIGQTDFRNFETNSPDNLIAQINSRYAETGVRADLTEDGRLRLAHQSDAPILLASGANYQPPRQGDTVPEPYAENTVLEDMGLSATDEENAAAAAQTLQGEGLVPQVGNGSIPPMNIPAPSPEGRRFQTAEEIEATNRAIMQNDRGGISGPIGSNAGGRAPHQPHESVPGTLTTGNRPMPVAPDSNAKRVEVPPGQETALGSQPLRAESVVGGATATGATSGSANQQGPQGDQKASYDEMTVDQLREHAGKEGVDLTGLRVKDEIIAEIKKHDKKKAREAAQ